MRSIRPRPICRACDSFSPSLVLWQHFVAPTRRLPHRPFRSSFATEAAQGREDNNAGLNDQDPAVQVDPIPIRQVSNKVQVRKITVPPSTLVGEPELHGPNDGNEGLYHIEPARVKPVLVRKYPNKVQVRRIASVIDPHLHPEPPQQRRHASQNNALMEREYIGSNQVGRAASRALAMAQVAYESSQDYKGVVVHPVRGLPSRDKQLPWVIETKDRTCTGEKRLGLEIQKFHEYVRPSPAENVARKHVIEKVRQHVREFLPEYTLEVFGSERTGISFATSDVDLRLVPKSIYSSSTRAMLPPTPEQRYKMKADLSKLHRCLKRKCSESYVLSMMRWARYPLISMQDRFSGLDIQIVLSNDTSLSRQFMQRYRDEYPCLGQLYSLIKATLDIRGLSDVFRGGVGSYPLFMMIVASLQDRPPPHDDAARGLVDFLRFWGNFKAEGHGISIEPPQLLPKTIPIMNEATMGKIQQGKTAPLPPWMLSLRDPADPTNDLGRKIIAWKHIQTTFSHLARCLRKDLKENTQISLLAHFIGPIHTLEKWRRKRISDYGKSLSEAGKQCAQMGLADQAVEGADAGIHGEAIPDLVELEAVAESVRTGEIAKKETAQDVATSDKAKKADQSAQGAKESDEAQAAARIEEVGDVHGWLKEIEGASEHKETWQAFLNILNTEQKADR